MDVTWETLDEMKRCKLQNRCVRCKRRTLQERIECRVCLEMLYCSTECLALDTENHRPVCFFLAEQKGLPTVVTGEKAKHIINIVERATFLNEDGDLKERRLLMAQKNDTFEAATPARYGADQDTGSTTTEHSRRRKKKRKPRKRNGNSTENDATKVEGIEIAQATSGKNSALSTVSNGRFGGPVKCDVETKKGEMFGKGWWKGQPTVKPKTGPAKSTAASEGKQTRFSDFFRNSNKDGDEQNDTGGDDDDDDKNKRKNEDRVSGESPSGAEGEASSGEAPTGLELVKYDPEVAEEQREKQREAKHNFCSFCKKTGEMFECTRCKCAGYCNKDCQRKDYKRHKDLCKSVERFSSVEQEVKTIILGVFFLRLLGGLPELSVSLGDVPDFIMRILLGHRHVIMLEIVSEHPHPFRHGAIVRDLFGRVAQILFYTETSYYLHSMPFLGLRVPVSLIRCIQPGNFILLLDAHWHNFEDGTTGIRIDDLDQVRFIFKK